MDGDSDDEGVSTEAHGSAIIEALGLDRRNQVPLPLPYFTVVSLCSVYHTSICEDIL